MYGERAIRLKVCAPPVDGKANSEVERFLAKLLGVSRSNVTVVKGASSRDKTVLARGIEPKQLRKSLTELIR
jgi:uncharacterized protein (TIGR00251 family)